MIGRDDLAEEREREDYLARYGPRRTVLRVQAALVQAAFRPPDPVRAARLHALSARALAALGSRRAALVQARRAARSAPDSAAELALVAWLSLLNGTNEVAAEGLLRDLAALSSGTLPFRLLLSWLVGTGRPSEALALVDASPPSAAEPWQLALWRAAASARPDPEAARRHLEAAFDSLSRPFRPAPLNDCLAMAQRLRDLALIARLYRTAADGSAFPRIPGAVPLLGGPPPRTHAPLLFGFSLAGLYFLAVTIAWPFVLGPAVLLAGEGVIWIQLGRRPRLFVQGAIFVAMAAAAFLSRR